MLPALFFVVGGDVLLVYMLIKTQNELQSCPIGNCLPLINTEFEHEKTVLFSLIDNHLLSSQATFAFYERASNTRKRAEKSWQ